MGSYDQAVKDSSKAYGDKMVGAQRKGIQTTSDGERYPHSITLCKMHLNLDYWLRSLKSAMRCRKKLGFVHKDSESGSREEWFVKGRGEGG